jgi:pimeloyl-ACP methyl ester carboxylesterase/DNA-binding CsgD family transcriptional regulator
LCVDLDATFHRTDLTDDPPLLGESLSVRLRAELVQEHRRTFDIGEEEGDRAGREMVAHARRSCAARDLPSSTPARALPYALPMSRQQTGSFRVDGHRIAFAAVGTGAPLVLPAWWVSNIVEDWKDERLRYLIEALAAARQVIRYDRLGCGMSDRERPDETLSLEFEVATLAGLLDHLGLERVSLLGGSFGGCTAVAYAARNPDRVDRLVVYGSFADGGRLAPPAVREAMVELVRSNWGLGSRMLADIFVASGDSDERASFARFQRRSATAEVAVALLELTFAIDVSEDAARLETPTLVVHRRSDRAIHFTAGEALAALAPNAELVALAGDSHIAWFGDTDDVLAAIAPFLGLASPARRNVVEELSAREREVLRLVAEGLSDADIAQRLVLSPHTVHRHVANILRKLNLHSRAAAAAYAARVGLV